MAENYPLQWPDGWPRTPAIRRKNNNRLRVGMAQAIEEVHHTLKLLKARPGSVVISTNVRPRSIGVPGPIDWNADDPGVAVYWVSRDRKPQSAACDSWRTVLENLRAVGKALKGMHMIADSEASQIFERAFRAFGELPASTSAEAKLPWWLALEIDERALEFLTFDMVKAKYQQLAKEQHPDRGGTTEAMQVLNNALNEAKVHYGIG